MLKSHVRKCGHSFVQSCGKRLFATNYHPFVASQYSYLSTYLTARAVLLDCCLTKRDSSAVYTRSFCPFVRVSACAGSRPLSRIRMLAQNAAADTYRIACVAYLPSCRSVKPCKTRYPSFTSSYFCRRCPVLLFAVIYVFVYVFALPFMFFHFQFMFLFIFLLRAAGFEPARCGGTSFSPQGAFHLLIFQTFGSAAAPARARSG